uniref:High-affinity choline transporter BetT n=1 Tax=Thermocrispum agreste TaxID=37925 RepID=A0A2W4JPH8_9PSEU|nr:MAG: high-affinity choline transporter BetT [Thermocrispum agreste]
MSSPPKDHEAAAPPNAEVSALLPDGKDRALKTRVFIGSAVIILLIAGWAIISPSGAGAAIGTVVGWISQGFGWYYFLAATLFLVFVVYVALSRYGKIKLGPQHSTPDYGMFAWASMFFAAGIGVDLIFFSVAGPVTHYLTPPEGTPETIEAARQGVVWTLFHYGITGWAMYALMGMALAYFSFRHRLPLAVRSALYPLIGKRIHGAAGDAVDGAAMLGTIFGVAVSLGIGVVQLNYGLRLIFDLPENVAVQIALIAIAVGIATFSAVSGVDKGIRLISMLNVVLAIALMVYVSIFESPVRVLNSLVMNIGDYVSRFPSMTMNTFAFDPPVDWLNDWTLFFWAWWIAWAPFVGVFLARISRGRTIRQFIAATLIIPLLFTLAFLSVFGNAALRVIRDGNEEFGELAASAPEQGFFALLAEYPGLTFSAGLTVVVGLFLYVTSADSAALVMSNLSSHLRTPLTDGAPWLRIFWATATGLLTLGMLLAGGVDALTSATIVMGLPFSFVMFVIMWGLYRALKREGIREDAMISSLPASLSERVGIEPRGVHRSWRQRLARVVSYPDPDDARRFVADVARPALDDVCEELCDRGVPATVTEAPADDAGIDYVELSVPVDGEDDFVYRLWPRVAPTPTYALHRVSGADTYVRFEVFLTEGGQGYDVLGYGKEQLIGDVLDQYERHLEYLRLRTNDR